MSATIISFNPIAPRKLTECIRVKVSTLSGEATAIFFFDSLFNSGQL